MNCATRFDHSYFYTDRKAIEISDKRLFSLWIGEVKISTACVNYLLVSLLHSYILYISILKKPGLLQSVLLLI